MQKLNSIAFKNVLLKSFFLMFLLFSSPMLFAQALPGEKKIDYRIDLNRRKTFWIPLSGHGWLYKGCELSLLEPLPDYASSGDPILSGKEDSESETHFLFRFRFAGYYTLHFFYQAFIEESLSGERLPSDLSPRSVTLYVYDTRRGFKDSSLIFDDDPLSAALRLPVLSEEKKSPNAVESQPLVDSSRSTPPKLQSQPKPHLDKETPLKGQTASFQWESHELFPSSDHLQRLLNEMRGRKEPSFSQGAKDPFRLGLYYFAQNNNQGMKESYRWFSYLSKKYPESELATEARERADYIKRYYILVR